jgi:hypothetical protein
MLSNESLPYLIDGMGDTGAGNELIQAIQNGSVLSALSFIRLQTCFGEDDVATNFQNAILGTYALSQRDQDFVKDAFSAPISVLASILDNLAVVGPSFSPAAGGYGPAQSVSLSSQTPGAKIYYTTNGSTPTTGSTLYSGPITVSSTETIKAIAVTSGTHNSAVTSALYTINGAVATPTFSPVAGSYVGPQSVTVSSTTAGATFYYTTNGSTPTRSSTLYSGPITVAASETVKVLGVKAAFSDSAIASAAYVIS